MDWVGWLDWAGLDGLKGSSETTQIATWKVGGKPDKHFQIIISTAFGMGGRVGWALQWMQSQGWQELVGTG